MTISALAGHAFEGRVGRAERAGLRNRMLDLTDHERYEADWPPEAGDVHVQATRRAEGGTSTAADPAWTQWRMWLRRGE